jgi:hypothetical protein
MMPGSTNRWKVPVIFGLAALALVLFFFNIVWPALRPAAAPEAAATPPAPPLPARAGTRGAPAAPQSLDPTLHLGLLASVEGVQYKGSGRNIFREHEEPTPIPKPVASALTTPAGPQPPPPINLRFFGFASRPGEAKRVFLSQGEDVFIAAEGDIVNRRYRVLHIGVNSVEVEDVLGGRRQVLPLTGG